MEDELMPYARFDDRYDDHRKIKRALRREPAAVAMHAMAITYANRHNSNGDVDVDWVEEKLALMPYKPAQRGRVLEVLLELCLFERKDEETFHVHDFLDWNLSREQRAELAEQGRRGGQAKAKANAKPPLDDGSGPGSSRGSSHSDNGGSSTPSPRHATPTPSQQKTSAALRADVLECFAYWQERCGHPQARFTADREAKIKARLREGYAVAEIRRGIDGAARAAFVNDAGKRFDDITLICRSGSKLEDFMGRATTTPLRAVPDRKPNASDMLRAIDGGAA